MIRTRISESISRSKPRSSSVSDSFKTRRKRRRRISPLDATRQPRPPYTALDLQRLLVERNLVVRKPLAAQLTNYLDLAESRLTWARSQLFRLWDPDWKAKQVKSGEGASARSPRPLVLMDARWWRWNIAFALLPAILIGTYCEFRGQYAMHEFHQQQELEQVQRLMGEEYVEAHRHTFVRPPPENVLRRIRTAVVELNDYLFGQSADGPYLDSGSISAEQSARSSAVPTSRSSTTTGQSPSPSAAASALPASENPDIGELLARLQYLETLVLEDKESKESRALARLHQSGVQNRMEDALVDSWKNSTSEKLPVHDEQEHERTDPKPRYLENVLMKVSDGVTRVVQQARELAASRTKDAEESRDSTGLKEADEPAKVDPPVSESSTNQSTSLSTQQRSSRTTDEVSRTRTAPSRWPWS